MRALTIRQPWASLIICGEKDVENRKWRTHHRGLLAIHAGQRFDQVLHPWQRSIVAKIDAFPRGAIIGFVDLLDVVEASTSRWAEPKHYHWLLADPRPIDPIPMRGRLRLWTAEVDLPARPGSRVVDRSGDVYDPIDDELWDKVRETALNLLAGNWKTSTSSRDVLNRVCEARGTRDLLGCWGISDADARQAVRRPGRLPEQIAVAMSEDRAAEFAGGHARPKALLALATALSQHTRRRH